MVPPDRFRPNMLAEGQASKLDVVLFAEYLATAGAAVKLDPLLVSQKDEVPNAHEHHVVEPRKQPKQPKRRRRRMPEN